MSETTSQPARRKFDWTLVLFGLALAGGGFYLTLVGFGAMAPPSKQHGPNWLAVAAGLVFFAPGVSLLMRAWLRMPDDRADLPPDAPFVAVAIQWLTALIVMIGLASIATWVAFGVGTREFAMSVPVPHTWTEIIGRTMFGFGAVVTWLMAALTGYAGVMKMLGKKP
jgi:hypothetical protein